jgi:hypothetical protein
MSADPTQSRTTVGTRASRGEYARASFFSWTPISLNSVTPRRFHDLNLSGSYSAIFGAPLLPFALVLFVRAELRSCAFGLFVVTMFVSAATHALLLFLPGSKGPNRFGDEPPELLSPERYVPPPAPPPSTQDELARARQDLDAAKRRLTPPA